MPGQAGSWPHPCTSSAVLPRSDPRFTWRRIAVNGRTIVDAGTPRLNLWSGFLRDECLPLITGSDRLQRRIPEADVARQFSTHRLVCWRISRHRNRACAFCLSRSGPRQAHPPFRLARIAERLAELGVGKVSYTGGNPALHDRQVGAGTFESLLGVIKRIRAGFVLPVSANYTLTGESVPAIPELLASAATTGLHDVVFQTFIHTGRRRVDERFAPADHEATIARVRDLSEPFRGRFPGGLRVHDYAQDGWFVVLDELGRFTLPTGRGGTDFVMGRYGDRALRLPGGTSPRAHAALAEVWRTRASTNAITDLTALSEQHKTTPTG